MVPGEEGAIKFFISDHQSRTRLCTPLALPKRSVGNAFHWQPVRSTYTTTSNTSRAGFGWTSCAGFARVLPIHSALAKRYPFQHRSVPRKRGSQQSAGPAATDRDYRIRHAGISEHSRQQLAGRVAFTPSNGDKREVSARYGIHSGGEMTLPPLLGQNPADDVLDLAHVLSLNDLVFLFRAVFLLDLWCLG
jgi:hypothetical protein